MGSTKRLLQPIARRLICRQADPQQVGVLGKGSGQDVPLGQPFK